MKRQSTSLPSQHPYILLKTSAEQSLVSTLPRPRLVSLSGDRLLVQPYELLEPGEAVRVTIEFLDTGEEVRMLTEVVWSDQQLAEMTLRIVEINEEGHSVIQEYCAEQAKHRTRLPPLLRRKRS